MDVSIVIPTKNAGELLKKVLEMVFSQETTYEYEVICVDSGSTDCTLDIIRSFPCRLYTIPAECFGHGKTRNYGAFKGTGTYIVFLTQDALPASKCWLQNFIDAMELDKDVAGGFGIHFTYPECNIFDARDIKKHFENFGDKTVIYELNNDNKKRYQTDDAYMHKMIFFSDNNSCVRRDVFEHYPYPDVDFAEDQMWAKEILERGYKKLYCPNAPVYHSHNYKLSTYLKRYYDEYKGLYQLHGFLIAKGWMNVFVQIIYRILVDVKYALSIEHLSVGKKLFWIWYAVRRNISKYIGGYLGGKYESYPVKIKKWLDEHVSQQYEQRKA